jgi:hypothetical protein
MTAVEDLDEWQHKSVPVTESAELTNLEKFAQYAVAVAARTRSVSRPINQTMPTYINRQTLTTRETLNLNSRFEIAGPRQIVREGDCQGETGRRAFEFEGP